VAIGLGDRKDREALGSGRTLGDDTGDLKFERSGRGWGGEVRRRIV